MSAKRGGPFGGGLPSISFDQQLAFLQALHDKGVWSTEEKVAILSIATSIKIARDHNLNCGRVPPFSN